MYPRGYAGRIEVISIMLLMELMPAKRMHY